MSAGRMSAGQMSAGQMSAGQMSAGQMSASQMSADQMSARQMSAGQMSAGQMSSSQMLLHKYPLAKCFRPNGCLIKKRGTIASTTILKNIFSFFCHSLDAKIIKFFLL
jgi:hypothetical protein